jgi:hypothetical protein
MDPKTMAESSDPAFLGDYLAGLSRPEHVAHGPAPSVREDDFRGRHIVITTTYEITVEGRPLTAHVGVSNDGSVHCHSLPAYEFASTVDMVRVLIDYFPDDFPPVGAPNSNQDEHGGGHHAGQM